ncbi:D-alanyl-D-alanine carboxypeptidase family protein [Leifsonia sp. NPDC080035]|uniref:D-alanyl-D-alanine carboxypeptidase family protein n=1 Tax=Leifsonia sp. NPDC080035 TaxID=3143936 RepID=A0AAU7GDZ4_9MICO
MHPLRLARAAIAASAALALLGGLAGCSAAVAGAPSAPAPARSAVSDSSELTDADGYIPDGSSLPLDSDRPAVTRLDPALRSALNAAAAAAQQERGTAITIADGWRSERYQEYLFAQAVRKYGSEDEALRWAKRGSDSEHVAGRAVDIATADAMDFLSRFGAEWGLCQRYANEAWHFELLTEPGGECPAQDADGRG